MRKLSLLIFTGIFFWGCMLATAWADYTSVSLSVSDQGTAFSLMQQTASSFFAVNAGDFRPYHQDVGPVRVFPMLYLSRETHNPPAEIWRRHKNHGWGRTAKEMGLSPNYHGKYISSKHKRRYRVVSVVDDEAFEEMMTIRFLNDYYGTDPEFLFYWRSRGLNYEDLFIAVNLGARIHHHPREFFTLRMRGHNWKYIAYKYHVPYSDLGRPVKPIRRWENNREFAKNDRDEARDQDDFDIRINWRHKIRK